MKFTPKTDEQIAESSLLAVGTVCDFEVMDAEEKKSAAGNDMIALKLNVWRPDGSTTWMWDYLLPDYMWKLKAFAAAVSMSDSYEAGTMEADAMIGKAGKLKIGVQKANETYPARNSVAGYVPGVEVAPVVRTPAKPATQRATIDDDIPF